MTVLDASALLAYVFGETGAERVEAALPGSVMHLANFTEVLSRLAERGSPPEESLEALDGAGVMALLRLEAGTLEDALLAARLRPQTRAAGLSLGDRLCLALALRLGEEALTADRAWKPLEIGVPIQLVR